MKRIIYILSIIIGLTSAAEVSAADYPVIGAQVFIEPGQSPEDIDGYFKILKENGMEVARIRMFGAHMFNGEKTPDFSLYDTAFDAAERHGIRLFATLFPVTDELRDVGGFKFPYSKTHLKEIQKYIHEVVSHFSGKAALDTWVLQNEPGTGGTSVHRTDLSDSIRAIWEKKPCANKHRTDFLKADFSEEQFLRYYTAWYLDWIATEVRKVDPVHDLHINPHALLHQLPEYDFASYENFLTSLGVSMHQSWHFGDFKRSQYPLGCAIMCDIIREKAGKKPFWVTELQGGNVTASGYVPFCPSRQEISQYLWTDIASGCKGAIFWTLNARKAVMEAGEWAMLDFLNRPSDRLLAAAEVACTVKANKEIFHDAVPAKSPIAILYNNESLAIQRRNSSAVKDDTNEARKSTAIIRSVISAYEAISAFGMTPAIASMEYFEWDPDKYPAIIIPNSISMPRAYCDSVINYVRSGGKAIVTGLTGFYDEDMRCSMMGGFPLEECFGGLISEFKVTDKYFNLNIDIADSIIPAHLWRGIIQPGKAKSIGKYGNDICATHNKFGQGEVYWIPSLINLGAYLRDNSGLINLYGILLNDELKKQPVRFEKPEQGILMRVTSTPKYMVSFIINTTSTPRTLYLMTAPELKNGKAIHPQGLFLDKSSLTIAPGEVAICRWDMK